MTLSVFDPWGIADFGLPSATNRMFRSEFVPEVEVREGIRHFEIELDVPGMKRDEIDVKVDGDRLVVAGERHHAEETDEGGWHRTERSYGRFERSFTLPRGVRVEDVSAGLEDGVLHVRVPKPTSVPEQRVRIDVPIGDAEREQAAQGDGGSYKGE
jgi:HSP20 family protein